jgi:maleate isomerase
MIWRVGLLIPSSDIVMEVDFYRALPHDTTLHTSRMSAGETAGPDQERILDQSTLRAADAVAATLPHVVVFGSTAEAVRSQDYSRELADRIERSTGALTVSVVDAVNQALRDTRASTVAVITPYDEVTNCAIKAGLETEGLEVSAIHGMGLSDAETAAVAPEAIYSFVQARIGARVPAEALFFFGTNYRALSALSLLKVTYDVPIVTSNLAALQAVKRHLDHLRERALKQAQNGQPPARPSVPWAR